MKVSEKIRRAESEGRPFWSFEYFPPKTENGLVNLYDRIVCYSLQITSNTLLSSLTTKYELFFPLGPNGEKFESRIY